MVASTIAARSAVWRESRPQKSAAGDSSKFDAEAAIAGFDFITARATVSRRALVPKEPAPYRSRWRNPLRAASVHTDPQGAGEGWDCGELESPRAGAVPAPPKNRSSNSSELPVFGDSPHCWDATPRSGQRTPSHRESNPPSAQLKR